MIRRKRTEIIIEEQTALQITWHSSGPLAWCQDCGEEVSTVSPEKAVQILGIKQGEIDLLIHNKVIHCLVSSVDRLAICVKSIITEISSCVDDNSAGEC